MALLDGIGASQLSQLSQGQQLPGPLATMLRQFQEQQMAMQQKLQESLASEKKRKPDNKFLASLAPQWLTPGRLAMIKAEAMAEIARKSRR